LVLYVPIKFHKSTGT